MANEQLESFLASEAQAATQEPAPQAAPEAPPAAPEPKAAPSPRQSLRPPQPSLRTTTTGFRRGRWKARTRSRFVRSRTSGANGTTGRKRPPA